MQGAYVIGCIKAIVEGYVTDSYRKILIHHSPSTSCNHLYSDENISVVTKDNSWRYLIARYLGTHAKRVTKLLWAAATNFLSALYCFLLTGFAQCHHSYVFQDQSESQLLVLSYSTLTALKYTS